MNIISGIWILDILNLLKYNGVDIFDSILRVDSSTWWALMGIYFVVLIVLGFIKAWLD